MATDRRRQRAMTSLPPTPCLRSTRIDQALAARESTFWDRLLPSLARPGHGRIARQPLVADFRQHAFHLDLVEPDVDVIQQRLVLAADQDRHVNRIEDV